MEDGKGAGDALFFLSAAAGTDWAPGARGLGWRPRWDIPSANRTKAAGPQEKTAQV